MKTFLLIAIWTTMGFISCNRVCWIDDDLQTDTASFEDDSESPGTKTGEPDSEDILCLPEGQGTEVIVNRKISFVIAVDSSGGMEDEVLAVQSSLNRFYDSLTRYGMDPRIILLSADSAAKSGICVDAPLGSGECPKDTNAPSFVHVIQPVGSKDALTKIVSAHGEWKDALHSTGPVVFIVVSDDTADKTADAFQTELAALDSPITSFVFYAIAAAAAKADACAISEAEACCLFGVKEGTVYRELAESTQGVFEDLCLQDIDGALERFARDAAEKTCEAQQDVV